MICYLFIINLFSMFIYHPFICLSLLAFQVKGNTEALCPHVIQLTPAIQAKFLRIHPKYAQNQLSGMRLELIGCGDNGEFLNVFYFD